MNPNFHKVVGIDLGTTYSAVASFDTVKELSEIIYDGDKDTTPSVSSYDKNIQKVYVGWDAKKNLPIDPDNSVCEIKREMGESFNPETLVKYRAQQKFRQGEPLKVYFADRWLLPQEVSAFTLMKMKKIAENAIGEEIRDAVITVPAYFTDQQRKATEQAALLAGIYPRQLIAEPTAAAICYSKDSFGLEKKTFLIYDLGGGTFDVTILKIIDENNINIISTDGDHHLGGGDFDDKIVEWVINKLLKDYQIDIKENAQAKARIKAYAEEAKKNVSNFDSTKIDLLFLNNPKIQNIEITKDIFLGEIKKLLTKTLEAVDRAIDKAIKNGVSKEEINSIILIGGSTKIPYVKTLLLDYFGKGESFIVSDADPDTAVARGAAFLATKFKPSPPPFDINKQPSATLVNLADESSTSVKMITEHSLGVGIQENKVSRILEQGTPIPVEVKKDGYINNGPSEYIPVEVYQGEGETTFENTLIGQVQIGPMEPKPAGHHSFEVIFKFDENGMLSATINHLNENKSYNAIFDQKTNLGKDELETKRKLLSALFMSSAPFVDSIIPPPVIEQKIDKVVSPVPEYQKPVENIKPDQPVQQQVTSSGPIKEPIKDIPEQFKQTVRRSKKLLSSYLHPELLKAYNQFIDGINSGKSESDMEEMGDNLADVYDVASKEEPKPGLLEPLSEVPEQFKSIIRRVKKYYETNQKPELLEAHNTLILAINMGKPMEEIEEIGDKLADVFDEIRK